MFQFLEHPSDRQAADAVRARNDWKYALGLELSDPGFHFSVLAEFRARLVGKGAEHLLLDRMLERFKARGLVKARGKQRTDSTQVLAAVHDLHLLELVAETLRAALDDLAAAAPDWLRGVAQPVWFERYRRRIEEYRSPPQSFHRLRRWNLGLLRPKARKSGRPLPWRSGRTASFCCGPGWAGCARGGPRGGRGADAA